MLICKIQISICDFCSTVLKENPVLELEALKEMRIDMHRCLELMQFVCKDFQTMAGILEMVEGICY